MREKPFARARKIVRRCSRIVTHANTIRDGVWRGVGVGRCSSANIFHVRFFDEMKNNCRPPVAKGKTVNLPRRECLPPSGRASAFSPNVPGIPDPIPRDRHSAVARQSYTLHPPRYGNKPTRAHSPVYST